MEKIKNTLRALLPTLRWLAMLTPNKVDDAVVSILEDMVNSGELAALVHARMQARGASVEPAAPKLAKGTKRVA